MDLNRVLLWMVPLAAALTLVRVLRARSGGARGWIVASLVVLAVTGVCLLAAPDVAGIAGGAAWALLVLLPSLGARWVQRLALRQQYRKARAVALWIRWAHPADGWIEQPELLRALMLAEEGEMARATAILQACRGTATPLAGAAKTILFRLANRWEDFGAWFGREPDERTVCEDPNLFATYVRALGETGELNRMMSVLARSAKSLESPSLGVYRDLCSLMAFAFCGRKEPTEALMRSRMDYFPPDVRAFWVATADMAAGRRESAEPSLNALLESGSKLIRAGVQRRLSFALPRAEDVLTAESHETLGRIESECLLRAQFGEDAGRAESRPYVTYALVAANCAAFAVECALGGSTDGETLYRLGALHVESVYGGEWWRVVASTFLHFGYVHLAMNMIGLYLLGPFGERHLGAFRYLLVYLAAGAGAMLAIVLLSIAGAPFAATFFVGASGSVMGLIGSTGAILLLAWHRTKSALLSRRMGTIALVVVLQVVFDLANPEVSLTAHSSGAVIGFAATLLLLRRPAAQGAGGGGASAPERSGRST